MDNVQIKTPTNELVIDKNVYILLGVAILIVIMIIVIYYLYKWYSNKTEADEEYDKSKTDLKIALNATSNKAIMDYLNTLKVVQGSDIHNMEQKLTVLINKLHKEHTNEIAKNKREITSNGNSVRFNRTRITDNKNKINRLKSDVNFIRRSINYDTTKILIRFIDQYKNKRPMSSKDERDLILDSQLFGLLSKDVYKLFDRYSDTPDLFVKNHLDDLLNCTYLILSSFQIGNYIDDSVFKLHTKTNYNSKIPPLFTYILKHNADIDMTNHATFFVRDYLPTLLQYIVANTTTIFNQVDELMINYYKTIPKVEFFNEFLISEEVSQIHQLLDNDEHLFTKIARATLASKMSSKLMDWKTYKQELLKSKEFTPATFRVLFVLIPEYLIMMKYQHSENKYARYIESEYFLYMPEDFLNQTNILNFSTILELFKCDFVNNTNTTLKKTLSDGFSKIFSDKRTTFEDVIEQYNSVVEDNQSIVADGIVVFDDFVCSKTIQE
ncbi:hypothetical protein QKU58_gp035 [Pyramimonas orientalis virus]|uniref:Uncharacterized protein n=1 Tax=Pyramimonas orientalis virus 01B TaxID=3134525 RepID=A0A7M3UNM7_9VIRU|nr:hypothetical protein QKU58_gp035 [Pyramimonas orientalis virus]QOI90296.1 hypothetical protein HWQ62_00159 [Pyramimonas orientalis virus]